MKEEYISICIDNTIYNISEKLNEQNLAPIFSDTWTGSQLWDASIFLSKYLKKLLIYTNTTRLIELGSGCGLCGIVASVLGIHDVVITDQDLIINLIKKNIQMNQGIINNNYINNKKIKEIVYNWGDSCDFLLPPFDYILISDCINPIYTKDSWRKLADSIRLLSNNQTKIYLSYQSRGKDEAWKDFVAYSMKFLCHKLIIKNNNLYLYELQRIQKTN